MFISFLVDYFCFCLVLFFVLQDKMQFSFLRFFSNFLMHLCQFSHIQLQYIFLLAQLNTLYKYSGSVQTWHIFQILFSFQKFFLCVCWLGDRILCTYYKIFSSIVSRFTMWIQNNPRSALHFILSTFSSYKLGVMQHNTTLPLDFRSCSQ